MAFKVSKALRNALLESGSVKNFMSNCFLKVYTGSQPADADAAPTGTLLCTYSDASGTPTREVLAQGTVTLDTGASGSVDTLTVNSIEVMGSATAFDTSLTITAANIATKINNNPFNLLFLATSAGAVVTLTAKPGLGALASWAVASTATTITTTDVAVGTTTAGVSALNGLLWADAAAGVLVKESTQVWSGLAAAGGVAGWCRFEAAVSDAGGADSTESIYRMDGAVATSGAELNMATTTITISTTQTITSFTLTLPTA